MSSDTSMESYGELNATVPGDQLLYHYTRADTALNDVLPSGALRLTAYRHMRDPLENKEAPSMLRYSDDVDPNALPLSEAQQLIAELRGQMRILSLTMDATEYDDEEVHAFGRGYARPRMWENYADVHTGVCLVFSAGCMTGPFYEQIKRFGAATCGAVHYTQGGFLLSAGRTINAGALTPENATAVLTKHITDHHEDFWFLKLRDWDSEYEYRFAVFAPTVSLGEPIDIPFGRCLRAVMLGERFNSALLPQMRELTAQLGIPLCRLDWSSGRPSVMS
jgi:hypothetical protein